ncbi:MAG: hypothetical protein NC210_02730 [[Clostridium] fimetarium]|nr:hypothetical protein [Alistipes timonensis]MCM1405318.1 hypothetical protein [[Clostridium] fimetarium]
MKKSIPVFAIWRMDFFKKRISPFFDVRGGWQIGKPGGAYANFNVGMRIHLTKLAGLNFSIGAYTRKIRYMYEGYWIAQGYWIAPEGTYDSPLAGRIYDTTYAVGLNLRIGVDF